MKSLTPQRPGTPTCLPLRAAPASLRRSKAERLGRRQQGGRGQVRTGLSPQGTFFTVPAPQPLQAATADPFRCQAGRAALPGSAGRSEAPCSRRRFPGSSAATCRGDGSRSPAATPGKLPANTLLILPRLTWCWRRAVAGSSRRAPGTF